MSQSEKNELIEKFKGFSIQIHNESLSKENIEGFKYYIDARLQTDQNFSPNAIQKEFLSEIQYKLLHISLIAKDSKKEIQYLSNLWNRMMQDLNIKTTQFWKQQSKDLKKMHNYSSKSAKAAKLALGTGSSASLVAAAVYLSSIPSLLCTTLATLCIVCLLAVIIKKTVTNLMTSPVIIGNPLKSTPLKEQTLDENNQKMQEQDSTLEMQTSKINKNSNKGERFFSDLDQSGQKENSIRQKI